MEASSSLEQRVAALEAEFARLKLAAETVGPAPALPWWEQRFGAFRNDAVYDEAAEFGRQYRISTFEL
jgi:hypothetical protein